MVILDTDHLTIIQRRSEPAFIHLAARFDAVAPEDVFTTIISFEEQMRGWLAVVQSARSLSQQVAVYQRLHRLIDFFAHARVLAFDERAASRYEELRRARIRIGTMDLRIAAIALTNNALLLSRNLSDFRKVPGLRVEDWTSPKKSG